MTEENKRFGPVTKTLAGTGVVGLLVGGGVALEKQYNLSDNVMAWFNESKAAIIETVTTNPYEARDELIEVIEKHREEIRSGKFDLGKVVDSINEYRTPEDVQNDATEYITGSETANYNQAIDNIITGSTEERTAYVAEKALDNLSDDGYKVIEEQVKEMRPKDSAKIALTAAENFTDNQYETIIGKMFQDSIDKYDNRIQLFKNIIKDQTDNVKNLFEKIGEIYDSAIEKGSELMKQYAH